MSHPIEDRLREAYQAKTAQLTEQRLDQLAVRRERPLDDLLDGGHPTGDLARCSVSRRFRPRRCTAGPGPASAAAAVVALAVGAAAVVANQLDSRPAAELAGPAGAPVAVLLADHFAHRLGPGPGHLHRDRRARVPASWPDRAAGDDVPWSAVGSGWRLVLPTDGGSSIYLYDPDNGRYLITDRLPAKASLLAWSPDGTRPLVRTTSSDGALYQEVNLRSGQLSAGFTRRAGFVTYTQPKGLAVLLQEEIDGVVQLVRYSTTGRLEYVYAPELPGVGTLDAVDALYLPDGGTFVSRLTQGAMVLMSNDGRPIRTYELPTGYSSCFPIKRWTDTSVLEQCLQRTGSATWVVSLYLQPVSGGAPTLLTTATGRNGKGYFNAWPISNGHILLQAGISAVPATTTSC